VTIQSGVGKGSAFTMTCSAPRAKEKPAFVDFGGNKPLTPLVEKSSTIKAQVNESVDRPKVLIAEDNPEMSEFVEGLLSSFCAVRAASNGVEALALVRRWRPDLVLSDVMMPLMDGIRLTKEIKSDKEISATPVVLLTAMTDRESLMAGWQAGADDYLFKPFHPKELEARVKSILAAIEWRRKGEAYRRQRDALEHFTHIASHDLREPLRKIINFTQLFQNSQKNLDKDSQYYLQAISDSSVRMYRLLNILMEYSRLDRKDSPFETADLKKIVETAEENLSEEIQKTGARITVGPLPEMTVIKEQVALVFQNLIGNSLKYRKDEGIPEIHIEAVKKDFEWVFSVSDNGIGFDPGQNEKIFIMFERLHGNEKYPGDGMGLTICRKIIETHGGRIWAEAKPGEGAVFYFTLPLDRETSAV
jgi:signal transduction histidine kinase